VERAEASLSVEEMVDRAVGQAVMEDFRFPRTARVE